jgi:hypothetical protein
MPITKATASSIAPAAKGDLVVGSATNDAAVLGVGTNDQVLTADSSTATGLKWATASSGGLTLLETLSLSGSSVTSSTISGSYTDLQILVQGAYGSAGGNALNMRFNGDTGSNYKRYYLETAGSGTAGDTGTLISGLTNFGTSSSYGPASVSFIQIPRYAQSHFKSLVFTSQSDTQLRSGMYLWNSTSAITSITFIANNGNFGGGTAYIYGVN